MIKEFVTGLIQFLVSLIVILVLVCGATAASPKQDLAAALEADRKEDLDTAIDLYSRAIASGGLNNDDLAAALNGRGVMYRLKGLHDLAIADYTRAIKVKANFAEPYSNRGLAYAKSKRYDPAILDFTRSIALRPDDAMTYLKRGNAYFDKDDLDQAIADWSRAIALKPDLMRAYYNRCDAYDRKGLRALAIVDCRKVLELEPEFQPAWDALEWLTSPLAGQRPCFCNY